MICLNKEIILCFNDKITMHIAVCFLEQCSTEITAEVVNDDT